MSTPLSGKLHAKSVLSVCNIFWQVIVRERIKVSGWICDLIKLPRKAISFDKYVWASPTLLFSPCLNSRLLVVRGWGIGPGCLSTPPSDKRRQWEWSPWRWQCGNVRSYRGWCHSIWISGRGPRVPERCSILNFVRLSSGAICPWLGDLASNDVTHTHTQWPE